MYKNVNFKNNVLLILLITIAFCTNSFSATVSDNDGSSFITKSEFDSLKNNFLSELNGYQSNIDSKIDNAIASYLSGIKTEAVSELPMLYNVTSTTQYKPKMVKNKTNTIKKQTFQGGNYLNSLWATYGTGPVTYDDFNPFTVRNFTQLSLLGNGYYDQMEGWTFSSTSPTVINNKYNFDNCGLFLSATTTMNQNFGYGDTADTWVMGIQPGTLNNKLINVVYTDPTGIGNGRGNWACGTRSSWLANNITAEIAKNNWVDALPIPEAFAVRYQKRSKDGTYIESVWAIEYMISHSTKDEDKNVYVYTKCDDVIYAHDAEETIIEEYSDYMNDVESSDVIGATSTNLYLSDKTEKWMWWWGWDTNKTDQIIGPRRNWRFTPKFKLKNTAPEVAPNTASVSGGTKYWNTLSQFKNGKIKFTNHAGTVDYPHFYGGIPLFALKTEYKNVKFDINISPTINTSATNVCIQVMNEEFPNGYDITAWSTAKKNALQTITGSSTTGSTVTNYDYNTTNNYLSVPVNTLVTISLDKPDDNKTYFIRWWEQGNADYAGGQIEILGNGKSTREQ